jgi:hypothetical protein
MNTKLPAAQLEKGRKSDSTTTKTLEEMEHRIADDTCEKIGLPLDEIALKP